MARNRTLVRLATLLHIALTKRVMPPPSELARELKCSRRHVYRLLDAMEEAHIPMPIRRASEPAFMRPRRTGEAA